MIVFFNLELLEREASNDLPKFMALLQYHATGSIAHSKYSKYKPLSISLYGSSFILNPEPIFESLIDIGYKVQYILLCGRRDYTQYKLHRIKSLDISYFPDLDVDKIKTNPLLKIVNKQIYFKFEEQYNGTKF